VEGIPQVLDGRRFEDEFGFAPVPLRQRLADAASAR